jgi:hypothetical protein
MAFYVYFMFNIILSTDFFEKFQRLAKTKTSINDNV